VIVDVFDRRVGEPGILAQLLDHPPRQEGVPAQIDEEVILARHARRGEQAFPESRDAHLGHRVGGPAVRRGARAARPGFRERGPVESASREHRQRLDDLHQRRDQRRRQARPQRRSHRLAVHRQAGAPDDPGDDPGAAVVAGAHGAGRGLYAVHRLETALDLLHLDALASQPRLAVGAPEQVQVPLPVDAAVIAGPENARVGEVGRGPRIVDEARPALRRPAEIAAADAGAADADLADFAWGDRVQIGIGDADARPGQGLAEMHRPLRRHVGAGGGPGGFGRGVHGHEPPSRPSPARQEPARARLPLEEDQTQAGDVPGQHVEQGRGGGEHAHPLQRQEARQVPPGERHLACRDDQRPPGLEREEDLLEGAVGPRCGSLIDPVLRCRSEQAGAGADEGRHVVVLEHHPAGPAIGAGAI
jgi:hypothetical protein